MEFIKPVVKNFGSDGNIFYILGQSTRALRNTGLVDKVNELTERIFSASNYKEALCICLEYVDIEDEE